MLEEIIALFPDAKPSLDFTNHFELLVAVMLSAQTTDAAVNKATPGLFAAFPTPQAHVCSAESEIASHISRLGLYRNKAKFLKKCAQQLLDDFDGQVPQTREELESLAGVGRKTANVVMSVGFGIPAFAVDTHVERISKHHDIVKKSATPLEVEKRVMDILPPEQWLAAHQPWFILEELFVILKIQSVTSTHSYMILAIYKMGAQKFLLDFRSVLCYSIW